MKCSQGVYDSAVNSAPKKSFHDLCLSISQKNETLEAKYDAVFEKVVTWTVWFSMQSSHQYPTSDAPKA